MTTDRIDLARELADYTGTPPPPRPPADFGTNTGPLPAAVKAYLADVITNRTIYGQ